MTIGELIELLADFDNDQEVRLAFQPSWPLQFEVGNVRENDDKVYIAAGDHPEDLPYAPGDVFDD